MDDREGNVSNKSKASKGLLTRASKKLTKRLGSRKEKQDHIAKNPEKGNEVDAVRVGCDPTGDLAGGLSRTGRDSSPKLDKRYNEEEGTWVHSGNTCHPPPQQQDIRTYQD